MSETNTFPEQPQDDEPKPQDLVESFMTSRGSVYTYDADGHTTRYKTVTWEQQPTQDLTVFVELGVRDVGAVASSYLLRRSTEKTKIQVVELQEDGSVREVTDIKDVQRPHDLAVATLRGGSIVRSKPASIFPEVGKYVFDSRQFDDEGKTRTERHLGHRVTTITPKTRQQED